MIVFELNQQGRKIRIGTELKKLGKIISKEFKKDGIISVATVDSGTSKKLNKSYRSKNKATDILTFVYNDLDSLGEIVLSYKEIEERARKAKKSIKETTLYLIVHGVCHIFGYTHKKEKDRILMEKKEKIILKKLI